MLKMGVCGGVSVEVDGRRIADSLLAGRQGRLALAYLVCERHRSVPREELAELLWPERLPSSWPASLSVVISKLRRLLAEAGLDGPASLHSAFGSYRLLLPEGTWVDWEAADDAVERAERGVAEGEPEAAVAAGREAAEIAGRGFLNDDCPWVDAQRERLRDLHVRALQVNVQAHLLAGQHGRAVITARDALALDELRESSFRLLMQALAAAGERGEALRVWERCRITLADELGVNPAPETEAIYLSILGEEPSVSRGAATPPTPTATTTLPSGVVTFFLTDIVDSSGLWERNPAAMAIALERHDRLVAETVGAHGGTVLKAKLEGDATVSVFPRASEAALAAMALRDELAAEPWPEGATIQLRMALHAGEAVERDGDYFGPALNRAARLRAMAGAGQILVSQVVAEVVRDHLPNGAVLASLGERQLRGLDRGEHVFQLGTHAMSGSDDVHSPTVERPPLPTGLASRGPFVGREPELDRLAVEWATATAGTARAVLIAGEPGVGKSRLAAEWARRAYGEGALVLFGRCDEEFGAPYQPFAEALRALLPSLGPARLRSIRGVEQLARLAPEVADHLPGGAAPGQADPDTERSLLFDGLARLFAVVGAEIPVVVVIDDLHWAAKPTLLLLRHLLRASEATRLLIVATYRSTDLSRAHPLAGVLSDLHRDGSADRLSLAGLAAEDVSAYLRAAGHDDTRLDNALSTVTSGNPFFLIEVLRHLEETGGTWDPTTLPQGVREAVDRRLSRLSELANEALLVGAVAGSRFSLELIEQVLGRDLVDPIDEVRRAGLVVEETGNRFRFYHALVRQSLLAECVSVKRIRIHQRIAAALEADPSSGGDANVADLARHYFECAFAGGAAKAVEYSRRAGEQAMARLAFEEAADLYAQALQAAEIEGSGCTDSDQAELLLVRCEALLAAGDPGAAGVVDQLTQAARRSPRLSGWATCFAGELAMLIHPERLESTVAEVAAAAEAFARIGDTEGEAKAHTVAASCLARLGRVADCEAALDRALVAARLAGNPRRVNAVLGFAPLAALWGPSPVPQASGRCLDVVRVLRITTGSEAVEAAALRCQAVLEAIRGRFDAARRMLGSARRSLESLGHTHGLLETDLFSGMVEIVAGQPADAEQLLRRAYDGFSARGVSADAAQAAALVARAMLAQNRIDEAIALSTESERFAGVDLKAAMAWRAVRAEALARQGQIPEAIELARSAVALVETTDALLDRAEAHLSLSLVLRAVGDESGAETEAVRAIDAYEKKGATALATAAQHIARSRRTASVKPASAPVSHRRVRANEAYRSWEHTADLFETGDIDGWAAWIAPDFVDADHISHVTSDRDTFVNAARVYATEQVVSERLLLASLGRRHALTRYIYRYEGSAIVDRANRTGPAEFDQLLVEQGDTAERHSRVERFKGDDLLPALARLVELHADDELPPDRREERYRIAANLRQGDRWGADGIVIDHRPAADPGDSVSPDAECSVTNVLGFTELATLLEWVQERHDDEAGYFRNQYFALSQYGDDGLLYQVDVYLPEQLDEALRQFDQLLQPVGNGHLSNEATRFNVHISEAELTHDWDTVESMIHESAVLDDRRSIVGLRLEGKEAFLAYVRSAFESGLTHYLELPLATRGERLTLTRATVGGPLTEVASLAVIELAEDGRVLYSAAFDPSDLDAAFAELDARYLVGQGAGAAHTLRPWLDFTTAFNRQDVASCHNLLCPDLTVTDHRPEPTVSGGDIEILLASLRASSERLRVLTVDSVEDDAALFLCHSDLELFVVCVTERAKIARLDFFPVDQRELALAQLSSLRPTSPPTGRRRVRPNAATAWWPRNYRLFEAGDFDAWAEGLATDFVDVDHLNHVTLDRQTFLDRVLTSLSVRDMKVEFAPLASLGERHALYRQSFRTQSTAVDPATQTGPTEYVWLHVTRTDVAGRVRRIERFRVDDLRSAVARLIELHADDELPPERRDGRYLVANSFRDQSFRVHHARWSDDVVMVDHRPASLWTLRGRDEIGNAAAVLRSLSADLECRFNDVLALAERLVLVEVLAQGHNDEAGFVEFRVIAITEYGDDGLVRRSELFRPDQIDEAFRRFDQLRDSTDRVALDNEATRQVVKAFQAILAGDMDAVIAATAEDAVLYDRRAIVRHSAEGKEAVLAYQLSAVESGVTYYSYFPIATRGERLSLGRTLAGGPRTELASLVVHEINEVGEFVRFVVFDAEQLAPAFAQLDERYLTGEGAPYADTLRPWIDFVSADNSQDLARCRELLSATVEIVDHRSVPSEIHGRDELVTAQIPGRVLSIDSVQHGAALFLCQSADSEMLSYVLCAIEQAKITRLEYLALDQRDLALARLHTSTNPPIRRRRVRHNAASGIAARQPHLEPGDIDGWAACLSADFVDVDHISHVTTDRARFLQAARVYANIERAALDREPLASLGDRHELSRVTHRLDGAALGEPTNHMGVTEMVELHMSRVNTDGLSTRLERFRGEDLHLALARLIELHAEDELPPGREHERRTIAEWFRNQRGGWSDDAVVIDYRPIGVDTLPPLTTDMQIHVTDVLVFTERMALIEVQDNSTQSRVLVLTQFGDQGNVRRSEWYCPEQIDDALDRFDELSSALSLGEFPPPNTAALARRRETDALVRGDLGAYLACFAEDVVYEDQIWRFVLRGVQGVGDNARHVLAMYASLSDVGTQLIATRGDRLSLHRSHWQAHLVDSGPIDVDSIELMETDQDGRISYFSLYDADSPDAAYAELDARYAAGEGAPFAAALSLLAQCVVSYNERDWVRFQSFLADDVKLVDHRPLGWGQLDRDSTVAIFQSLVDLAPDNRSRVRALYRITHHGVVISYQATGTDSASGGEFTRDALEVMIFERGRIQRLEFFPADDVQRALDRFDELCSAVDPGDIQP